MINQKQNDIAETSAQGANFKDYKLENLHPEVAMKKEKIFSKADFSKRKTKIIN